MSTLILGCVVLLTSGFAHQVTRTSDLVQIPMVPTKLVEYMHKDNLKRYKTVQKTINDIEQKYYVDKYQSISAITQGMSSSVLDLAYARQELRENGFYASIVPQFKPAGIKPGKQRELWDSVEAGCIQINSALLSMMDADISFQGNFYRLHNSLQTALTYMDNGLEYTSAMDVVQKQLNETKKMQINFKKATDEFSHDAFETLRSIIKTANGPLEIQQQLQNREQYYYDYTMEFEEYERLEDERLKILQPFRSKLAEGRARYEVAKYNFENAKNSSDYRSAQEKIITNSIREQWDKQSKIDQHIEETRYRQETTTSGWWLWKKTHTKQIPYTVKVQNPERIRIEELIGNWETDKKENDQNLKSVQEIESKWKNETEEAKTELEAADAELKTIEKIWKDKLDKQAAKVDIAHTKWYDSFEAIENAINETGISSENIVEVLKLIHQLPERAMKTHQANKGMEELIESLYSFIETDVGMDDRSESIKEYFGKRGASNNFERIYSAMGNAGLNIMSDLEIMEESEYDEIIQEIDAQLQNHSESTLKFGEKRRLRSVIKGKFNKKQVQSKTFQKKFRLIMDFFKDMHGGLRVLKHELPFFSSHETAKYVEIGMDDKQEL